MCDHNILHEQCRRVSISSPKCFTCQINTGCAREMGDFESTTMEWKRLDRRNYIPNTTFSDHDKGNNVLPLSRHDCFVKAPFQRRNGILCKNLVPPVHTSYHISYPNLNACMS